jgi:hypothetical protein
MLSVSSISSHTIKQAANTLVRNTSPKPAPSKSKARKRKSEKLLIGPTIGVQTKNSKKKSNLTERNNIQERLCISARAGQNVVIGKPLRFSIDMLY